MTAKIKLLALGLAALPGPGVAASDIRLIEAAQARHHQTIGDLLKQGVDPNTATPTGETALHWAAHRDDLNVARELIHAGAKIVPNRYGLSALVPACANGNAAMIELLLDAGADPNLSEPDGRTPLMVASKTGKSEAVRTLLTRGARVDDKEHAQAQTALMWAAAEGHADVVRQLVRAGAQLEAKSKGGFTALHFAARQGKIDVLRALIELGAGVNGGIGSDGDGPSALALAVTNLHFELGAVLLQAGADPNYTWQGRTVLHILTWVSRLGIGTNDPVPEGSGNLSRLDLLRELAKHGADLNRRMTSRRGGVRTVLNMKGATPFLLAARTADAAMMRLLAELGADPLLPNEEGTTPLLVAAGVGVQSPEEDPGTESEVLESVKVAVELGNDVNAVDQRGETAMHGAAYKYAAAVVPYLMEKGAKIEIWNRKNKLGWTPLRIATGVHRAMNLRSSPKTAAALRQFMVAAGVSTELEPETNISGATN